MGALPGKTETMLNNRKGTRKTAGTVENPAHQKKKKKKKKEKNYM